MLHVPNILNIKPEISRAGTLTLKIEFLNRSSVNNTLEEVTGKLNETAIDYSSHGNSNDSEKDLVAHVYNIHVETAKKSDVTDYTEFHQLKENHVSLGKLNQLRSLYLKARLEVLRFQHMVDILAGVPDGIERRDIAKGIETASKSNRFDESIRLRYGKIMDPEVNVSRYRNEIKALQSSALCPENSMIKHHSDTMKTASEQQIS